MQIPLQITFRHMEKSEAVEANIQKHIDKLEQYNHNIMGCHVIVDVPDQHRHKGGVFSIHIHLTIPGEEIVVSSKQDDAHAHEDIYVALRDAFKAAQRQLEARVEKMKRKVKVHEAPPHGTVTEVYPNMDYGRIKSADGRDVYFHANSLVNGELDKLEVGDEVRFAEEPGDEGPQASSVQVVGKHHIVG